MTMDENTKNSLKGLVWSILITLVNGLITIFNPATKEVASIVLNNLNC